MIQILHGEPTYIKNIMNLLNMWTPSEPRLFFILFATFPRVQQKTSKDASHRSHQKSPKSYVERIFVNISKKQNKLKNRDKIYIIQHTNTKADPSRVEKINK